MAPKQTLEHVLANTIPVTESGCWIWLGNELRGYGQIRDNNRHTYTHLYVYEQLIGPIQKGLTIDHICRVTQCVNPAHMEQVTNKINIARGTSPSAKHARQTHCKHGHELSGENLRIPVTGRYRRICRTCEGKLTKIRDAKRLDKSHGRAKAAKETPS